MLEELLARHGTLIAVLGLLSVITFALTLAVLPFLVAAIPPDYFTDRERAAPRAYRHPLPRLLFHLLKNLAGLLFLAAGFIMLFIPGQGLLTILIGLTCLDFPGKRRLELKLISLPKVRRAVEWVRKKAGARPLMLK